MTEEPRHRPLPPRHVLPPPQDPQRYYGQPQPPAPYPQQQPPPGWPTPGQQPSYQPREFQSYQPYLPQQQQPWGPPQPPWGYGGWAPPPPRRRRSPFASAILAVVGIGAALFFVLILLGALTGDPRGLTGSVDHSPARAAHPGATPVDPSNAQAVVERNTLYEQGGLDNGNCPPPDLGDASKQEQTVFYESLMNCLNDEWRPVIEGAGYSYTDPGLVVFDSAVNTPCGNASPQDGRTLAFYCPGDTVMYADVPQMRTFFDNIDVAYAIVIGHEFGHHVQRETGILDAFDAVVHESFDQRLVLNRRVELQASCMGGLFLGAIADSFPMTEQRVSRLQQVAGSFGDEPGDPASKRDHGSGTSNREWITNGYTHNDVTVCNTFTAPADHVD